MMEGFGFPPAAGRFRFKAERDIVRRLVQALDRTGTVLDLGSGIGFWADEFARRFAKVVAVEASTTLCDTLRARCAAQPHVRVVHGDALSFEPDDRYELVFLGGMLMLNDREVIALLRKIVPALTPGGMILCRETTVREGVVTRTGEYQATYHSPRCTAGCSPTVVCRWCTQNSMCPTCSCKWGVSSSRSARRGTTAASRPRQSGTSRLLGATPCRGSRVPLTRSDSRAPSGSTILSARP